MSTIKIDLETLERLVENSRGNYSGMNEQILLSINILDYMAQQRRPVTISDVSKQMSRQILVRNGIEYLIRGGLVTRETGDVESPLKKTPTTRLFYKLTEKGQRAAEISGKILSEIEAKEREYYDSLG